jgi:hypothetical protein
MKELTLGQKKSLVLAYCFGVSEIQGNTWYGLCKAGMVVGRGEGGPAELSEDAVQVARGLIEKAHRAHKPDKRGAGNL